MATFSSPRATFLWIDTCFLEKLLFLLLLFFVLGFEKLLAKVVFVSFFVQNLHFGHLLEEGRERG